MPDLTAIFVLYQTLGWAALSGAPSLDREALAAGDMATVTRRFLSREEQRNWHNLAPITRAACLRKGRTRFRNWEQANPDVVAVLKRKALGATALA